MEFFIILLFPVFFVSFAIYHNRRVRRSMDYRIAFGIFGGIVYGINIVFDGVSYSFNLDGFNIVVSRRSLYVNGVKLIITNDDLGVGDAFPNPGLGIIGRIMDKLEDITSKDKRDEEELIRKDAFISLYKMKNEG